MVTETVDPVIECRYGYLPVVTEGSDCAGTAGISVEDVENESDRIGSIRDEEVRDHGMGMAAGEMKAHDLHGILSPLVINDGNDGTGICGSMEKMAVFFTAAAYMLIRIKSGLEPFQKFKVGTKQKNL